MQHSKWIALGFSAVCLIAVATVLRAEHLYYMAAILLCLPGVSYFMGWYGLRGLEFTRELPSTAWEGQEGVLRYRVRNRSRMARYFLTIHEALPEWIVISDVEPPLFNVEASGETQVLQQVTFRKRGVFDVDAFIVTASDPLGVFAFSKRIPCEGEIVVYPNTVLIATTLLSGSERFGWQEFVTVLLHGSSTDPDGVRPYIAGDPLRHIHWRQTARTGRLSVIEFEEAQAVNLMIVLDARRGTDIGAGINTTLEYGVRLAASISEEAIRQGAAVSLIVPSDSGKRPERALIGPVVGRGQAHLHGILDTLARVEARSQVRVSELLNTGVERTPPGTAILVITADSDPDLPDALLRHTAVGARTSTVYIDPATFGGPGSRAVGARDEQILAKLLAASTQVFRVRHDPNCALHPEEITHERYASIT
jgi:uncharacterized protein (DUF58 family)